MLRFILSLYILIGLIINVQAQILDPKVESIKDEFINFHYQNTIDLADSLLGTDSTLTEQSIIELYRMKGISQFVLGQEYNARNSFLNILELDPVFQLDPVQNSPKIIRFFNDLKLSFLQSQILERPLEQSNRSGQPAGFQVNKNSISLNHAMWRSIVLPGWGHRYLGRNKAGNYLSIGSLLLIPTTFYYVLDTYNKEKNYLNETDQVKIHSKYDAYNNSYKLRNIMITSYAVFWIYTQFDLFTEKEFNNFTFEILDLPDNQHLLGLSYQYYF